MRAALAWTLQTTLLLGIAAAQCPLCVGGPPPELPTDIAQESAVQELLGTGSQNPPDTTADAQTSAPLLTSDEKSAPGFSLQVAFLGGIRPVAPLEVGLLLDFPVQSPALLFAGRIYSRPDGNLLILAGLTNSLLSENLPASGLFTPRRTSWWGTLVGRVGPVRLSLGAFRTWWDGNFRPMLAAEWASGLPIQPGLALYGQALYPSLRVGLPGGWALRATYRISRNQLVLRWERRAWEGTP